MSGRSRGRSASLLPDSTSNTNMITSTTTTTTTTPHRTPVSSSSSSSNGALACSTSSSASMTSSPIDSPSSTSLVRKRTLQDMANITTNEPSGVWVLGPPIATKTTSMRTIYGTTTMVTPISPSDSHLSINSSPQSAILPRFEFDTPIERGGLLSDGSHSSSSGGSGSGSGSDRPNTGSASSKYTMSTIASSPMSLSNSSQSQHTSPSCMSSQLAYGTLDSSPSTSKASRDLEAKKKAAAAAAGLTTTTLSPDHHHHHHHHPHHHQQHPSSPQFGDSPSSFIHVFKNGGEGGMDRDRLMPGSSQGDHHDDVEHGDNEENEYDPILSSSRHGGGGGGGGGSGRPEIKRRRTAPDVMALDNSGETLVPSPQFPFPPSPSPTPSSTTTSTSNLNFSKTGRRSESPDGKRGNGKDGLDVWPSEVEEAFHAALSIIPKLGRKKVMVNGKPCGRNELIADHIRRKTGKLRTRKQVSSHIQVLKNMRKGDVEFMKLIADSNDGDEPFHPNSRTADSTPSRGVPMAMSYSEGLLSPYTPTFLHRSFSCGTLPLQSTGLGIEAFPPSLSPSPLSVPMSVGLSLTNAMNDMHLPAHSPRTPVRSRELTIIPTAFCLWADDSMSDASHIFANLEKGVMPSGTVHFEELAQSTLRFPGLVEMNEHLSCDFLHIKLNLSIPADDGTRPSPTQLHTLLTLNSQRDVRLTAVTSIYSYGTQVLSLEEHLGPAKRINGSKSDGPSTAASPICSSSLESNVAMTQETTQGNDARGGLPLRSPGSAGTTTGPGSLPNFVRDQSYPYSYDAPFASDFWSIFLRGAFSPESAVTEGGEAHLPSFSKTGDERSEFAMAISGLSVIQEFVVTKSANGGDPSSHKEPVANQQHPLQQNQRQEEPHNINQVVDDRQREEPLSPGSALGDVVLVVTYDFECKDSTTAGLANLSLLSVGPKLSPAAGMQGHLQVQGHGQGQGQGHSQSQGQGQGQGMMMMMVEPRHPPFLNIHPAHFAAMQSHPPPFPHLHPYGYGELQKQQQGQQLVQHQQLLLQPSEHRPHRISPLPSPLPSPCHSPLLNQHQIHVQQHQQQQQQPQSQVHLDHNLRNELPKATGQSVPQPTLRRSGGHSPQKPSLSLHIPPPADFSHLDLGSGVINGGGGGGGIGPAQDQYVTLPNTANSNGGGPITPWPQLLHTPTAPPPVCVPGVPSSNAQQGGRLEQIWAQTSNEWELASPALMGAFPLTGGGMGRREGGVDPLKGRGGAPSHQGLGQGQGGAGRGGHMYLSHRGGSNSPMMDPQQQQQHHHHHHHQQQQLPMASQAMRDMTTQAIAAGTPILETFPSFSIQSHGAPFIHPAHNFGGQGRSAKAQHGDGGSGKIPTNSSSSSGNTKPIRLEDKMKEIEKESAAARHHHYQQQRKLRELRPTSSSASTASFGTTATTTKKGGRMSRGRRSSSSDSSSSSVSSDPDMVATTEAVKQIEIQDYFTGLLGSSTRYSGV